ncbi:MAG: hypothetical protein QXW79_00200 [Thermoplasmata archaeon]
MEIDYYHNTNTLFFEKNPPTIPTNLWNDLFHVQKFQEKAEFSDLHSYALLSIISSDELNITEKNKMVDYLLGDENLEVGPDIISKLLEIKEETNDFVELYEKIICLAKKKKCEIFTYQHLYQLVLQIWMDHPNNLVSTDFRKKIIYISFGGKLPNKIVELIKSDIDIWFVNLRRNREITNLIYWLCTLDESGELEKYKNNYERIQDETSEKRKTFQKLYNMCIEEYYAYQQRAKANGLCKYIRRSEKCPHGTNCIFYHGKVEETYGIQMCKYGEKCSHLPLGECKFVHIPNKKQLEKIRNLYSSLQRTSNGFLARKEQTKYIDSQCLHNPFFILKKIGNVGENILYIIPECNHVDEYFGIKKICKNPVRFMTKKNCKILNFYCNYEHMVAHEPRTSYVVKQNVLNLIQ